MSWLSWLQLHTLAVALAVAVQQWQPYYVLLTVALLADNVVQGASVAESDIV